MSTGVLCFPVGRIKGNKRRQVMSKLQVGFGRVNINPPLGAFVAGYFIDRFADGVLDDLEASAVAFELGGKRAVIVTADLCEVPTPTAEYLIKCIGEKAGLQKEDIFFVVSHSHTSPAVCLRDELVTRKSVSDDMLGSGEENLKINNRQRTKSSAYTHIAVITE